MRGDDYMISKVNLNEEPIIVSEFYEKTVTDNATRKKLRIIGFNFKVTSDDYHKITTLLYKNDFQVNIPEKGITFHASINSYSTSITNLYVENQVGDFKLELIEHP